MKAQGTAPAFYDTPFAKPWTEHGRAQHSQEVARCKFLSSKKVTMTEQVMIGAKKEGVPGCIYNIKRDFDQSCC